MFASFGDFAASLIDFFVVWGAGTGEATAALAADVFTVFFFSVFTGFLLVADGAVLSFAVFLDVFSTDLAGLAAFGAAVFFKDVDPSAAAREADVVFVAVEDFAVFVFAAAPFAGIVAFPFAVALAFVAGAALIAVFTFSFPVARVCFVGWGAACFADFDCAVIFLPLSALFPAGAAFIFAAAFPAGFVSAVAAWRFVDAFLAGAFAAAFFPVSTPTCFFAV